MRPPIGPFWRYYGGKWRASGRYPAPAYRTIVEPFAGAAGYACRWHWHDVVLIDRSPVIAGIWRWLIEATPDDVLAVPPVPEGGTTDDIDAPQAARDLVGFWNNNGAAEPVKHPSDWAKQTGHNWGGWERARPRVAGWVSQIKHWTIIEGDYTEGPSGPATRFVDPPYQTRAGSRYPFSDVDHAALGAWCLEQPGQVIACDQQGSDWLPWISAIDIKGTSGRNRTGVSREVVYHRNDRAALTLPWST